MPLNGSGVFNRLRRWAGETNISQTEFDQDGDDVAQALSSALYRDGQAAWTGSQNANGKMLRGLGAPQSAGDALSLGTTPASEVLTALGFTPVQQATGIGQSTNTVKLGYKSGGGALKATVDNTDLGSLLSTLMSITSGNSYIVLPLPGGIILQVFLANVDASGQAYVSFPQFFPNACLFGGAFDQGASAYRWGWKNNGTGSCQITCRNGDGSFIGGAALVIALGN